MTPLRSSIIPTIHAIMPVCRGLLIRSLTVLTEKVSAAVVTPLEELRNYRIGTLIGQGGEARVLSGSLTTADNIENIHVVFRVSLASVEKTSHLTSLMANIFKSIHRSQQAQKSLITQRESEKLEHEIELIKKFEDSPYIRRYIVSKPLVAKTGEVIGVLDECQGSLDKLLTQEMSFTKLLGFLADTSEAVAAMHAAGYIHSDIKPANIFISLDGSKALLGDFGATTAIGEPSHGGTTCYMKNNQDVEFNTEMKDLYALALTVRDLINLPGFVNNEDEEQLNLKEKIEQFIKEQLNTPNPMPAKQFAHCLREFFKEAEPLNFAPLGSKNAGIDLLKIQNIRAGFATMGFVGG